MIKDKLCFVVLVVLQLSAASHAQDIENGWNGIRPLITAKTEINKLLGVPVVDVNGYHRYQTKDAHVTVNYTSAPCKQNKMLRGIFKVPENTVLDYIVLLKQKVEFETLKFSIDDYIRDQSGDLKTTVTYSNQEMGVSIDVGIYLWKDSSGNPHKREYVEGFRFFPRKDDKVLFSCETP